MSALLLAASLVGLTVRVDASHGAPRIVVDNRPVRARMFWGHSVPHPLAVQGAGPVEFTFQAETDEPGHGTMHFRFGHTPGDVVLDDIRVRDVDTGRDVIPTCDFEGGPASFTRDWTSWPPARENGGATIGVEPQVGRDGSAGLHIHLPAPPDGHWPDFHIYHHPRLSLTKGHHYRVSFWAQCTPARGLTIGFYRPGTQFLFLGGPDQAYLSRALGGQIRLAAEAGVDLVSFPVPLPWPAPGQKENWDNVDAQCAAVLRANPHALLVPRVPMEAPDWWRQAHPDDVMRWEDGPHAGGQAAVASPLYLHDASARLSRLVTHLESTFGEHVAGYHPSGQNTGEWFYEDTWKPTLSGYAPVERAAWRTWLAGRYADDAALQRAWHDPQARLADAELPTPAARHAAPAGVLRDPARERAILDFNDFQQQKMADCVCHLAQAVRTASQGRKLVVFFYGYLFEFGAVSTGPAVSGHYALRQVLNCPAIDVLCSPISYFDRGLGESAPAMTAAESVALAGKLWLNEDDTATYLSAGDAPGWKQRVQTIEESNALLVRNVAEESLRNFGTWWMDLGGSGWFNDRRMWAEMARLKTLDDALLAQPTPFRPEVAAVIDEQGMRRVAAGGTALTHSGIYEVRKPLGRMGAPYGQYLADDVAAGRVAAKLYVMLSAWAPSAGQRKDLLQATHGTCKIWCYAPGWFDGDRPSPEAMRELTGFQLQAVAPGKAWVEPTALGQRRGLKPWGTSRAVRPLFAVADAQPDEVLARYPDGSAAVALRKRADGPSLFVGVPGLTSELLRLAAREAGVHLWTDVDCNVYANGPYVALHAAADGPLTLDVARPARVSDLFTGLAIGTGPRLSLPLKFGETRVLRIAND